MIRIFCFLFLTALIDSHRVYASTYPLIDHLLELPEEKIDIGQVALKLSKEVFPHIDINTYSREIDQITTQVRKLTQGKSDPDYRIRALNTYLYKTWGIKFDKQDPNVANLKNRYINGMLDTRKGSCVTMPLLYLAVSQRLGYPIYAVTLPRHIILRYRDNEFKQNNIEATGGGAYVSNEEYTEVLNISFNSVRRGTYLKSLSYREYLGLLIEQNGIYWGDKGDFHRSIYYLEAAIKLNPRNADSINSLGFASKGVGGIIF